MNEISVKTSFGDLVACVGGDDEFPEILVFLRNQDGNELSVAVVTDNSIGGIEDVLRVAVYGDPREEDMTNRIVLTRDALNDPNAMWL